MLSAGEPAVTGPRRCAVLGSPIGHSLSPVLHHAAYAALGLDWRYDAVEVTEGGLAAFLDGLDDSWRGLSLTMPLKRTVVPLLDEVTDRAGQAGAANTVVLENGPAGRRRVGHNTDVPGAVSALRERGVEAPASAVVLGGGATAASVLLALADLGCTAAVLVVRDPARTAPTLRAVERHPRPPRVEVRALDTVRGGVDPPSADVFVATVPGSAQDEAAARLTIGSRAVFDVSYDPWPSRVARAAAAAGLPLVGGLDLLVHQAALQVELMLAGSGVGVDRSTVLAAMRAAISSR